MTLVRRLQCDMKRDCAADVTHIGEKGYVYCGAHAVVRRARERCRKMTAGEKKTLLSGGTIASYRPAKKPRTAAALSRGAS